MKLSVCELECEDSKHAGHAGAISKLFFSCSFCCCHHLTRSRPCSPRHQRLPHLHHQRHWSIQVISYATISRFNKRIACPRTSDTFSPTAHSRAFCAIGDVPAPDLSTRGRKESTNSLRVRAYTCTCAYYAGTFTGTRTREHNNVCNQSQELASTTQFIHAACSDIALQRIKLSFPRNHSIAAPLGCSRRLLSSSSSSLQHRSRARVHHAAQERRALKCSAAKLQHKMQNCPQTNAQQPSHWHHLSGCHSTALVRPTRASTRSKYLQHATQCMKSRRGVQGAGAVAEAPHAQLAQL
jgi:hypothetical protein